MEDVSKRLYKVHGIVFGCFIFNYQIKVLVGFQRPPPLDARGNAASF